MSNNGFAVDRDPLFNENNLIWMDLEMTGLEPQINRILEMAAVITDPQLNVIAEGPVVAIHQDASILSNMDSWNTATHTRSGLVNRCLESKVTEDEAAQIFIDFFSNTFRQARARSVATLSVKTVVSWPAGHRAWSSSSITATSTFLPSKNASNAGLLK